VFEWFANNPPPHKNTQNSTLPPNCSDHEDQNIPTFVVTSPTHDQVVLVIRWIFILWIHDLGMDSPQSATYIFIFLETIPLTNQTNELSAESFKLRSTRPSNRRTTKPKNPPNDLTTEPPLNNPPWHQCHPILHQTELPPHDNTGTEGCATYSQCYRVVVVVLYFCCCCCCCCCCGVMEAREERSWLSSLRRKYY